MREWMNKKKLEHGKWAVLFCGCLLSAVFLRAQNVQSNETVAPADEDGIDYCCVGDAAIDFKQSSAAPSARENVLALPSAVAKRRCRPPLVPPPSESSFLGSAMDFDSGYGGMLSRFDGDKQRAIAAAEAELTAVGWHETAASVRVRDIKQGTTVRMFERDGAWLLAVSVAAAGIASNGGPTSAVFVAGQWRRDILEKL